MILHPVRHSTSATSEETASTRNASASRHFLVQIAQSRRVQTRTSALVEEIASLSGILWLGFASPTLPEPSACAVMGGLGRTAKSFHVPKTATPLLRGSATSSPVPKRQLRHVTAMRSTRALVVTLPCKGILFDENFQPSSHFPNSPCTTNGAANTPNLDWRSRR